MNEAFHGAKVMLFVGPHLVALRRDHTPGIPWPGCLDFPGGGREGGETPVACVIRETREELGITLLLRDLKHALRRESEMGVSHFFAAHLPATAHDHISFGGEGAGWQIMTPLDFMNDPTAIPHFVEILRAYLESQT